MRRQTYEQDTTVQGDKCKGRRTKNIDSTILLFQAEGTTHAETWGGWVIAGRLICHSAEKIARSKTREGSRVPHEKNIVGQF